MNPFHRAHEAGLPVAVVSITLVWCPVCMAWLRYAGATWQTSDDDLEVLHRSELHFGPFDGTPEVVSDTKETLTAILTDPVAPWVPANL